MAVIQNLYQIFKIPASFLVAHDCKIENYTRREGFKNGNIVSIGDNLVFQQIRYLHGDYRTHQEIFNKVKKYRDRQHEYKKEGKYKEAQILEQLITHTLFVDDIINVYVDGPKKDFEKFSVKGFDFNGKHYIYLCSGAGQIRRNTATFINADIREPIVKALNCGLDEKTSEFVLAKYSAYFALAFSSILWVRTPRVCVIKDFNRTLKNTPVDFICKNAEGKSIIEERIMDLDLNCADGQGLIDPNFAKLWGEDMALPFTPCSFVARSCFVKGNLVTFDFREYAHTHGITTIRDKWGKEYNIDEIDVLLSESQFKTHKYYSSWQEYLSYAEKGNIHWGVARYNKQFDDEFVLANYQYIQALTLSKEDIHNLVQPTIKWIQQICSGDTLFALLYMFGPKNNDSDGFNSMYGTAQTDTAKAVVKNVDFLRDTYVQHKIYKNIAETINKAKIGKIWLHGNYQFMIADPLAQCQSALGLEPTGILQANEVYSNFWRDRDVKLVDLCRSPMIDAHEHNPCTVVNDNEDANYWFRFIRSGIIYNTYDTSCARHSDSDYDGDIVLSTDNPIFIKGSHKDHNIITYDKGGAKVAKMTIKNITKTVAKGFGSGVGGFSNTATILYAMAAIFDDDEHRDQYNEIMTRIKLLREIVGQEIDRIKGADKPFLPSDWKKYESISEADTPEQRLAKFKHNAMVVSKKPYFFRYLYSESNALFKQFEASYNEVSLMQFDLKFKKLLKKENKTEEEKNLVRKYQKYSPLITAPCTMNILCREVESVDFDIKFSKGANDIKKKTVSLLPTYESIYANEFDENKFAFVKSMYKHYNAKHNVKRLDSLIQEGELLSQLQEDFSELRADLISIDIQELQQQLANSGMSGEEFLFYCNRISQTYANFNWGFAWDILEDQIIKLIPFGKSFCPVRDEENGVDYLGVKYSLKDITNKDETVIQKLMNAVFGIDLYSMPLVPDEIEQDMEDFQKSNQGGVENNE